MGESAAASEGGVRKPRGGPALAVYVGLVRSSVQAALAYRGRMVLWLITGFFPFLLMAVWLTVVAESGPPAGWTAGDFVAYYGAAAVLWHLSGQHVVWEWDQDMRSGDLSIRLLRPIHPFHQYAADDIGHRLVLLSMLVPPLLLAVVLAPVLRANVDVDVRAFVLVPAAVALAYLLSLLMASTVALLGFWSTQTTNIWMLCWGLGSFTSGWVAPLDLMPRWLRELAIVLPFRSTLGFPVELVTGRLDTAETVAGFVIGAGWTAVFARLYVIGWRRGVRRYQAVAG